MMDIAITSYQEIVVKKMKEKFPKIAGGKMMTILILILTLTNPSVRTIEGSYKHQEVLIVKNPNEAAIKLYYHQDNESPYEHWEGELFELDLSNGIVKKIEIPNIKFINKVPKPLSKRKDYHKGGNYV